MNFHKDNAVIFLKSKFIVFLGKNRKLQQQKCQNIVVGGFHRTHGKLASGFTILLRTFEQTKNCN